MTTLRELRALLTDDLLARAGDCLLTTQAQECAVEEPDGMQVLAVGDDPGDALRRYRWLLGLPVVSE